MECKSKLVHVYLVSFPGQGHLNPLLRLGKCLASKGLLVTFSTPESFGNQMRKANNITDLPIPVGDGLIRFEFFEDEWDEDDHKRKNLDHYLPQLELVGKKVLPLMIRKHAEQGRPVACLFNNPFIPWVSDVAADLGIPSGLLWIHSCACFSAYYHEYHGLVPFPTEAEPEINVQLPCMPLLRYDEIGTFLHPAAPPVLRSVMLDQFKKLDNYFCTLMDTFQELETGVIEHMSKICPIKSVGPLYKNPKVLNTAVRGDFMTADDCICWLDSKPPASVVYISFGSIVGLKQEQIHEIAYGVLNAGVQFLWVMKPPHDDAGLELPVLPEGFLEKVGEKGKIVRWSPQEQVLAHPSVAFTVSHCGWNSSLEALSSGAPVVAFPQWGDQLINAKFLVDEFKVGVRLCRGVTENKLITRDEVEKCLMEATTGPKAAEMKKNAMKWKKAAELTVAEGGPSERNLQCFVDEILRKSVDIS